MTIDQIEPRPTNIHERYWSKVHQTDSCWEWTAATTQGYGMFRLDGRMQLAHRLSYAMRVGPIPEGFTIDHLCRNRACVNPAHLEAVTNRTNLLRGQGFAAVNARKTHCPQGHDYDKVGTVGSDGRRFCRTCKRDRARENSL